MNIYITCRGCCFFLFASIGTTTKLRKECAINKITFVFCSPSIAAFQCVSCVQLQVRSVCRVLFSLLFGSFPKFPPIQTNSNFILPMCVRGRCCCCCRHRHRTWHITETISERHSEYNPCEYAGTKETMKPEEKRKKGKKNILISVCHTCKRLVDIIHSNNFNIYLMKMFSIRAMPTILSFHFIHFFFCFRRSCMLFGCTVIIGVWRCEIYFPISVSRQNIYVLDKCCGIFVAQSTRFVTYFVFLPLWCIYV